VKGICRHRTAVAVLMAAAPPRLLPLLAAAVVYFDVLIVVDIWSKKTRIDSFRHLLCHIVLMIEVYSGPQMVMFAADSMRFVD
jgi:hypothetical protein